MYIYKTTNIINNKIYIGQHNGKNANYMGSGIILLRSIKKYGIDNFKKEILEYCETKELLNEREKYWINKYNSIKPNGYNIDIGGQGGDCTIFMNDDEYKIFCEKISIGKKGKTKGIPLSDLNKKGISDGLKKYYKNGGKNWNVGQETKQETKDKISQSLKGREFTEEWKEKLKQSHSDVKGQKNPMYGKKVYDIWIEKYGLNEANIRLEKMKEKLRIAAETRRLNKLK